MADIELKSFPFDSMKVLNEESGQMEDDREYEAEIFRNYFKKFLSNGVYFGHYKNYGENSMKVVLDIGLNIKVLKGAGFIEGADFENENDKIIVLERPSTGSRIDRIVVQMNTSLDKRNTNLIVKKGNGTTPAELTRTENIYEICLAEVTVKSTTNLTEEDIVDKRLDKTLCGIVNSLISVDGEEIYQNFQDYIDEVTENLVRKDQDSVINGNVVANSVKDMNNKSLSTNDFDNTYKTKLDGIDNGANKYVLPTATSSILGGVKVGSNITNNSATISLTKNNVVNALGYTPPTTNTTYGVATTSNNGLMSAGDKTKLNSVDSGANKTVVDSSLSSSSTNPVQNKVVTSFIDAIENEYMPKTGGRFINGNVIFGTGGAAETIISGSTGNIKSEYTNSQVVDNAPNLYITNTTSNFRRSASSSKRYKKNITETIEDKLDPERLYDLPVKQFKYKEGYLSQESKRHNENILGFIVEDLQEIYECAVEYNEDETPEMWNYKVMIPAMLKLIQKQHKEIEELKSIVKKGV